MSVAAWQWLLLAALALGLLVVLHGVMRSARRAGLKMLLLAGNAFVVAIIAALALALGEADPPLVLASPAGQTQSTGSRVRLRPLDILPIAAPGRPVADPARLLEERTLVVTGAGLSREHWRGAPAGRVEFAPGPALPGVHELRFPGPVRAGELVRLTGRVEQSAAKHASLRLESLELSGGAVANDGGFNLAFAAPPAGRFVLTLAITDAAGELLEQGPVPLSVAPAAPLRVLGLAAAPSFRWRELQRWLARSGARLTLRMQLGRDLVREAWVNTEPASMPPSDARMLSDTDLVIADVRAWEDLADAVRRELLLALQDAGLGVLLLAVDGHPTAQLAEAGGMAGVAVDDAAENAVELTAQAGAPWLAPLQVAPQRIAGGEGIWTDAKGGAVAAFARRGAGRVALVADLRSYRWVAQGHEAAYATFWSHIVATVAKPVPAAQRPRLSLALPSVDLRLEICFDGAVQHPAWELQAPDHRRVSLEVFARPASACALLWPRVSGWHRLLRGGEVEELYVFDPADWMALRYALRGRSTAEITGAEGSSMAGRSPWWVDPSWWLLPLLIACGLLWLEHRLHGRATEAGRN